MNISASGTPVVAYSEKSVRRSYANWGSRHSGSDDDDTTVTFTPLTDQELSALSNIAISLPDISDDTNDDNDSSDSDSDDGWETTEEVSDHDDEVTGHNDDNVSPPPPHPAANNASGAVTCYRSANTLT